ncbi:hypothetical protein ACFXQA_05925 [Microbacterium sp. P07]
MSRRKDGRPRTLVQPIDTGGAVQSGAPADAPPAPQIADTPTSRTDGE